MIKVYYGKEVFWNFTFTGGLDIIALQFNLMYQSIEPLHRGTIIHTHTEIIFLLSTMSILICFHTVLSSWHLSKLTLMSLIKDPVSCFYYSLMLIAFSAASTLQHLLDVEWWLENTLQFEFRYVRQYAKILSAMESHSLIGLYY